MAMDKDALASEIAQAMGHSHVTQQLKGFAQGIIEEVRNGTATFNLVPTPHPISAIVGPNMAQLVATYAGYGYASPELTQYCTGVATYIMASGIVTYASPESPPTPPDKAWFLEGTISGLVGSAMASTVASFVPFPYVSKELLAKCTAICNHIVNNAEVESGVIS